jgi:hypothetical protein
MPRRFCTAGPCDPALHAVVPPTGRLPELRVAVAREQSISLHGPPRSGKTTAARAFAAELRAEGMAAVWAPLDGPGASGRGAGPGVWDVREAEPLWLAALAGAAAVLPAGQRPPDPAAFLGGPPGTRLGAFLSAWARALDVPLVLLLDGIDSISGDALLRLLRQLRAGAHGRDRGGFPRSVVLIGARALREGFVQAQVGAQVSVHGVLNFLAAAVPVPDFTPAEVVALLGQHTAETGQPFTPEAAAELARLTGGQPFLVNALADLCVSELVPDRGAPVGLADVERARERLILARTTHLDSLGDRLRDPRVAGIVQAVLLGDDPLSIPYASDDFQAVLDLGLLRRGPDGAEAANPLYREVLVRQLSLHVQEALPRPAWPWAPGGRLDLPALLDAFRAWWRENADLLPAAAPGYPEALPHLALCAFLQRVVNGGGHVHRELAAGRGAMDVLVRYGPDRFAIELKRVRSRDSLEAVIDRGADQLCGYLDTVGLDRGWLVVFDVRPGRSWPERLWTRELSRSGKTLTVLGA